MPSLRKNISFLGKYFTSIIGGVLLFFAGATVNRDGAQKRILFIFGGGIGDVVIGSVACGYIKKYLADHEAYYLMPYKFQLPYAKENIFFNYRKAKEDPFYYFALINQLRAIGFSEVILLFPFWEGFLSALASDVKSDRVFFYKEKEPNAFYRATSAINRSLRYFSFRKRTVFIRVASGWGEQWEELHRDPALPLRIFPSIVGKQAYATSQAIKTIRPDVANTIDGSGLLPLNEPRTELAIHPAFEAEYLAELEEKYHVRPEECCLIGLGSSDAFKNWDIEKFVAVAKAINRRGLRVAIIDQAKDAVLVKKFADAYGAPFLNLGAEADLPRLFILIKHASLVVANDTSFIHLAIALKTPSVCVVTNAGMGAYSFYGYPHINKWVYPPDKDKGSLAFVRADDAINACDELIQAKKGDDYQKEKFLLHFGNEYRYASQGHQ